VIVHSGKAERALLLPVRLDVADLDPRDIPIPIEDRLRRRRVIHPAAHDTGPERGAPLD
jgi:hypothetical protein